MSRKGDIFTHFIQGPYSNQRSQCLILFIHKTFHNVKLYISGAEDGQINKISREKQLILVCPRLSGG